MAYKGADGHIDVYKRTDCRPGAAELRDLPDEHSVFCNDRITELYSAGRALAYRKCRGPVCGGPQYDLGRFEHIVPVLFPEVQKLSEPSVLFGCGYAFPGAFLRVGQLRPQRFILSEQGIVVVQVTVDAVQPVDCRGDRLLDRRLNYSEGVMPRSDLSVARNAPETDQDDDCQYYYADLYSVFPDKFFQLFSRLPCSKALL